MLKLVFPLRRLPTLSREEFQRYWYETHGPLVRRYAKALRIRRYVQLHTLDDPINAALQASRGAEEPYDGVAELWWESREDLERALGALARDRAADPPVLRGTKRAVTGRAPDPDTAGRPSARALEPADGVWGARREPRGRLTAARAEHARALDGPPATFVAHPPT